MSYEITKRDTFSTAFSLHSFGIEELGKRYSPHMKPAMLCEGTDLAAFRCVVFFVLRFAYRCPIEGGRRHSPVVYHDVAFTPSSLPFKLYGEILTFEHLFHIALLDEAVLNTVMGRLSHEELTVKLDRELSTLRM